MKILYLQDSHIKGKNSENRIGNYYADIMTKIKEVILLSKKLKVDKIIHGGDLFDSELVSNIMSDEFIDLVEDSTIEWYILPGNHDECGNNWEVSKSTSLAHIFRRCKLIKLLDNYTLWDEKSAETSIIKGFKYFHNIEEDIKNNGLLYGIKGKGLKIAIVHALITLKSLPYQCMHVVANDIKVDFDIVLVAHNHNPWGIKEINGTKFINIGCLGRRKIDERNISPSVLLIDTETKELEIIKLKSVKESKEVFDLMKVQETKIFEEDINNFIKSLDEVKIQSLDIRGTIEYLAKEKNIDKEVKDEIIKRIGESEYLREF